MGWLLFVLVGASALQHQGASPLGRVTASPHLVRHVAAELTRSLRAGERRDGIGGAAMTEELVALALTRTAAHPSLDASRVNRRLAALGKLAREALAARSPADELARVDVRELVASAAARHDASWSVHNTMKSRHAKLSGDDDDDAADGSAPRAAPDELALYARAQRHVGKSAIRREGFRWADEQIVDFFERGGLELSLIHISEPTRPY